MKSHILHESAKFMWNKYDVWRFISRILLAYYNHSDFL